MRTLSPLPLIALLCVPCAISQDLSAAFAAAQQMVANSRQSYNPGSQNARDNRVNQRASQPAQPDYAAIRRAEERAAEKEQKREQKEAQKRAIEQEQERVKNNLANIDARLVAASAMPPMPPMRTDHVDKSTAAVEARMDWLTKFLTGPPVRAQETYSSQERREAIANARAVRDAIARGERPPFQQLWDYYEYNRSIAKGLMPEDERCAVVMSMTLGLEPGAGEVSVKDLPDRQQNLILGLLTTKQLVAEARLQRSLSDPRQSVAGTNTETGARIYANAKQLSERLKTVLGPPQEFDSLDAAKNLNGRKGIVYLDHAYLHPGRPEPDPQLKNLPVNFRRGDHLDIWNSNMNATDSTMPFNHAQKVLFWELK
jgi:hypothetical protein